MNPLQQERKRLEAIKEKEKQQQDDDEEEEQDSVPSSKKLPSGGRGVLIRNVNVEKKVRKLEKEGIGADGSQFQDVEENVCSLGRGRGKGRGRILKKINGE